jgi:hypothetical protein
MRPRCTLTAVIVAFGLLSLAAIFIATSILHSSQAGGPILFYKDGTGPFKTQFVGEILRDKPLGNGNGAPTRPPSLDEELPILSPHIPIESKLSDRNNNLAPPLHVDDENSIWCTVKRLFNAGKTSPQELIRALRTTDPLQVDGGPSAFVCPQDAQRQRLSDNELPRWEDLARFRNGDPATWIFYQHLRKAGGTGFCQLATDNMGRSRIPPYYCMVDNRGSLATPPWNNSEYTVNALITRGFRITANEWDVFYESMFGWPGAVFATTIRDPIDRIFSQYRFEHLERRDGSTTQKRVTAKQYYNQLKGWTMGANYYIKTFEGSPDTKIAQPKTGDFYWTYHKFNNREITWEMFVSALRNIMKFQVIFVTEWLDATSPIVLNHTLGWTVPPKKVLPHEVQALRGNAKSITAEQAIPPDDYNYLLLENALDLLFFRCVQRIYLERLKCDMIGAV